MLAPVRVAERDPSANQNVVRALRAICGVKNAHLPIQHRLRYSDFSVGEMAILYFEFAANTNVCSLSTLCHSR